MLRISEESLEGNDLEVNPVDWNQGKGNSIDVFDKNHKILNLPQAYKAKEIQNLMREFKSTETLYKAQIETLTEENTIFKTEIDRLNNKIHGLSCKINESNLELQRLKEHQFLTTTKNIEALRENESLKEKLKKTENFYKLKQEKLKTELEESKSKYETLESEFSKKLTELLTRSCPPAKKDDTKITSDQLLTLINQKKALEQTFAQKTSELKRENSKYLKTITGLKRQIEGEKQQKIEIEKTFKDDISSLIKDIEALNKEIDRLQRIIIEKEVNYNADIKDLNIFFAEREAEYLENFEKLQEDYQNYKFCMDSIACDNEINLKVNEFVENIHNAQEKIDKIYYGIDLAFRELIKHLQEYQNKAIPDIFDPLVYKTNETGTSKLITSVKAIINSIEKQKTTLEAQQENIFKSFESLNNEISIKEKENIKEIIRISNENLEINQKLSEMYQLKADNLRLNKAVQISHNKNTLNDDYQKIIDDLTSQNKSLQQKLKIKIKSTEKKKYADLETWELREEHYKNTVKTLGDQIKTLSSQVLEIKKFSKFKPDLKNLEIKELKSDLSKILNFFEKFQKNNENQQELYLKGFQELGFQKIRLESLYSYINDYLQESIKLVSLLNHRKII